MSHNISTFKERKHSTAGIGMALATFLTIMSQLPQVVANGWSSPISRIVWIAFFGIIVFSKWHLLKIRQVNFSFITIGIYILFVLLARLVNGGYNTALFSCVLLSFFVLVVGLIIGKDITEQDLFLFGKVYTLSCLVLGLVLYFDVYRGYDITSVIYAYGSKNSAGVILFTGALVAFVYGWSQKKLYNLLNILVIAFLLFMVLIMKVRSVIICIPLVAFCAVLRAPFRRKLQIPLLLLCLALLIALQFDSVYDLLVNNILFANRGDTLADASSGRMDQWKNFARELSGNELFGDGKTERESLILTACIQCGIPMGFLIISYAVWPFVWTMRRTKRSSSKHMFFLLLVALSYFIVAIFEQLAPFGPGARCFCLWLLFGIILSKEKEFAE